MHTACMGVCWLRTYAFVEPRSLLLAEWRSCWCLLLLDGAAGLIVLPVCVGGHHNLHACSGTTKPSYSDLLRNPCTALQVLAPTRELAQQIEEETIKLAHFTKFRTTRCAAV